MSFSKSLVDWYLQNMRFLPWRETKNPYHIWLSEIILQQTRVAQGLPYFERFLDSFPTVFDLANANEEDVLKLWQGLGYYSRARNLHHTAKFIVNDLNGVFPQNFKDLLKLKGVGEYTAAAIASFSYNEKVAVLDGNVFRVLARFYGVELDISDQKNKKDFFKLAQSLIPDTNSDIYNQAIMEFGALQCVPKSPNCSACIFNSNCSALQQKKVDILPIKLKKTKVTERFLNYLIIQDVDGGFVVEKRLGKGIWQNLYQFPMLEEVEDLSVKLVLEKLNLFVIENQSPISVSVLNNDYIQHKLSHQALNIRFYKLVFSAKLNEAKPFEEVIKLPFPIVIYNFIESNFS